MTSIAKKLVAFLAALALVGCGDAGDGPGAGPGGDPVEGGTVVFGILTDFQAFNPVTNTNVQTGDVNRNMLFTPLIRYDADLQPQPYLAESWELTDSSVTFRLRNDVTWHDGEPVTADDVAFTFDLAKNEQTASLLGSAFLEMIESAEVVDDQTIRFDFVAPHSQALDAFWWSPLPQHLLQDVAPAELQQAQFNQQPVGSGPFRFVSWQRGQELVLEANDAFPADLGGRPNVDRVVFRVIPEATTMMTELVSGGADVIAYTLLPDQAQQLAQQGDVRVEHFPSREFTYIGWNNENPIFADAETRRALAMGIDRPQIIEALLHGYGEIATGMIPSWSPMNPGVDPLPFDPDGARTLLAQAGWQDSNNDGILERDGQPLRFELLVNAANQMHQDIATVMQQQLNEIGAAVELRTIEFQTMLQRHRQRDYQAVISNWTLDTFKVDPTPLFSCEEASRAMSANRAGYCNEEVDAMISQGLATTDDGEAQQIWQRFSEQLQQDQPITFLFWQEDLAGVGPRPQGVEMDVRSKIVNISDWWIPENMQRR